MVASGKWQRICIGEIVDYRLFAGVLGLVGLGAFFALRKRLGSYRLPQVFAPTVGASVFGAAAIGLLFMSGGGNGQVGAGLSSTAVAAVLAAAYTLRLARLLTPSTS